MSSSNPSVADTSESFTFAAGTGTLERALIVGTSEAGLATISARSSNESCLVVANAAEVTVQDPEILDPDLTATPTATISATACDILQEYVSGFDYSFSDAYANVGGHLTTIAHVCRGFPALPDGYGRNTPTGRCTGNYCNQDATATLFYGSAPGVGAISVGFGFQRDPDQSGYTSRAWGATYSGGAGLYPSPTCQQDRVPAHGGYGACRHEEPANPGRTLEFCEDGTAPQTGRRRH